MKRKRGPAPHIKKHRAKSERHEDQIDQDYSEGENDVLQEEESFKGFSSDEDEKQLEPRAENDKSTAFPANGTSSNKEKRATKSAPTQEELMELLFRSSSFQSNLFKLQVDELLSEVRVKYEKMEKVEAILHKLKDVLMQLPESQEQLVPYY
jgi:U3 small nucleolar RNA-associated protein 22